MKSHARWHVALAAFLWLTAPSSADAQSPDLIINEVLVDPASDLAGDANGDGVRDTYADEFIEIVNRGGLPADASGWLIGPPGGLFALPAGTVLAPGEYLVLFGGGTPTGLPGRSLTANGRLGSGLSNTAGRLFLIDPAGPDTLQDITYSGWDTDGSWVRVPEGWGDFADHGLVSGAAFSPSGPSRPGGGPDQSGPTLYRVRVANLTASGFSVAWRTPWAAAGRLELLPDGGSLHHRYDPGPASRLHRVDYYGLAPAVGVEWRAVSGGSTAPSDSLFRTVTAVPGTSVPYTVYGELVEQAGSAPVAGGQVFLRSRRGGLPSGWLLAVSDSAGSWAANLGNLHSADGGPFAWSVGDTLEVEADGPGAEVTSAERVVSGSAPQHLPLPSMAPDPAPLFTWTGPAVDTQADRALTLGYALQDAGEAWATLFLHLEDGSDPVRAITLPAELPVTAAGSVTLDTSGLPEGSDWQVSALVEDGRNTPEKVFHPARVRIAHAATRELPVPAGIRLFTPTLQDPTLAQASDWLDRLPGPGELARWDSLTASWSAAARLADGSRVGDDFALQAGRGYALVSASAGTVRAVGPRRYAPAALGVQAGLSLLGIADSLAVRAADTIFDALDVLAVSRWDVWRQQWQGRFRLPDGRIAGDDFLISWGEAVAVTVDSAFSWQPVADRVSFRPESPARPHRPATMPTAAALLLEPGPGVCSLIWRAPPGARVVLADAAGLPRWSGTATGLSEWRQATVSGLPGGTYTADLAWQTPAGRVRIQRAARIGPAGPPALPTWLWGAMPAGEGTLLLSEAGVLRPVRSDPETETWYAQSGPAAPEALLVLAPDGGWDRWPLVETGSADGLRGFAPKGAPLSVTGLEVVTAGPLAIEVRFQVLDSAGPVGIRQFLGYGAAGSGGGPPGDPRRWVPAGEASAWEPGDPPGRHDAIACPPGPDGQEGPEAVAVRLQTAEGGTAWLGPVPVPRAEEPPGLALLPAVPNPFNPVTQIRYRIPEGPPRHVRLEVRDVRGRRVRVLEEGLRGPGLRMVIWEGTDGSGRRAAAGVYLVLLEVDGVRLTRKVLLLK